METQKTAVHFVAQPLLTPTNPLTVFLIGAGGSGSHMLTKLAELSHALHALGHAGLQVYVWDDDQISPANLGRQVFARSEVGLEKAVALVNRTNRFFGTNWKAIPHKFCRQSLIDLDRRGAANVYISCVDTVSARLEIADILNQLAAADNNGREQPLYWMDLGNTKDRGQYILSTVGTHKQPGSDLFTPVGKLPFITEEFSDVLAQSEQDDDTPSCSLADALEKQDMFINSTLANLAGRLLWSMFREGILKNRGGFLNLSDLRALPLPID